METLEAIYSRRSIRKFTGEVISNEEIQKILKAGFAAPSAHNEQPWEFIVIKEINILENMAKNHPYAKMLPDAGCGIIVCGDKNKQKSVGFLVSDCSAAIENMLLASHALNLGAVWCGLYPVINLTKMVKGYFNLPESIIPIGLVVIGHKAEDKKTRDRYDESRIHYEKW